LPEDVLCILVKAPVAGEVKTRLAPAVGLAGAAVLARAFLDDTLSMARGLGWAKVVVVVAGDPAALQLPEAVEVWPQGDGDLGARMERALIRALRGGGHALLVGTDSPGLPPPLIEEARAVLSVHDAVLGPTDDGGFYLIGLSRCGAGLLAGLPWSCSDTLLQTEARLRQAGHSVARSIPWFDVDEPADLTRLARRIASGELQASATARALASVGVLVGVTA
jgi:rSAM/selenodomain-associated transferase 1